MSKLSAEQVKQAYENNPDGTSHALADSLRDFGYPVTDDWVKEEIGRLLKGEEPRGLGPALFLWGWLEKGID